METSLVQTGIYFRWFGVAGFEVQAAGHTLLVDPFFTRPPFRKVIMGRVAPNEALVAQYISGGDYILVTHAHYDHIMDVPPAAEKTGAVVLGSANTCALLEICGLPPERLQTICAGDRVELGPFQVEVFSSQHIRMPAIYRPGPLRALLRPPLRLRDYRMDVSFSFRIEVDGLHILLWGGQDVDGAQPADVLLTYFMSNPSFYRELMKKVRPALAVPLHWDNLFRPLTRPLRPSWRPPRLGFPMWLRARPQEFARMVARSPVRAQVLIPTIFQSYDFAAIVRRNEEGNGAEKALDGG